MRISDWSSDVCSSDLASWQAPPRWGRGGSCNRRPRSRVPAPRAGHRSGSARADCAPAPRPADSEPNLPPCLSHPDQKDCFADKKRLDSSEQHTSELQSLMRISYAVFCLKKKTLHSASTYTSIMFE